MPRRATIRRSGSRASAFGLLALASVLGVLVVGVLWLNSLRPATQPAKEETNGQAPEALLLSDLNGTGVTPVVGVSVTPDVPPEPTLRRWDADATGIVPDAILAHQLDRVLAGVDGHIGIAVKDLGSGRGAVLNGSLELQSASLYKLPVLYSVFAAGLRMAEPLPITDEALSYDAGTMELGPGETLSVAEALERMVALSDNTSAIMLATRVGVYRINSSIAALGMDSTHYSLERMTTSALDMLRFVERVAEGDAVSSAASADMLHLMLRQRVNDRLPRLLPLGVQVAHKTGNLPGTVNDVGVLYGPHTTIAVAALVSDTTNEAAASAAIAQVARTAYVYFDAEQTIADRPVIPPAPARPVPPVWREPHPPTPTPTAEPTDLAPTEPEPEPTATPAAGVPKPTPLLPPPSATPVPIAPTSQSRSAASPTPGPPAPSATPVPPPPQPTPTLALATKAPTRRTAPTPVLLDRR